METKEETVRPYPENKVLKAWVLDLGGPVRVTLKWGVDESTLWRWTVGELETPSWVMEFIKISEVNAARRTEIAKQKREIERLKNENSRMKDELKRRF